MRTETIHGHQRVILNPGEYFVTEEQCTISTLLGSCVASCLYDPVRRVMGMNHFMLSNRRYSRDLPMTRSEAGRYGIQAMELLINAMLKLGAKKHSIKAKAFGGGTMTRGVSTPPSNFLVVGEVNCRFIREFLANEEIPLVAEDLGGHDGRVIHFSPGDYSVYVRPIRGAHTGTIARRDRQCWLRAIEEHEQSQPDVDLWL